MTNASRDQVLYVSPAFEKIWGCTYETLYTSPVDYLLTLPEAQIGTITFIQPGREPLPPEVAEVSPQNPPICGEPIRNLPPKLLLKGKVPTKEEFWTDPGMVRPVGAGRT